MKKAIDVEWVPFNIKVTIDLDAEDLNPVFANLLWTHLPYNSLQNHALVSGNHLYHIVPFPEMVYKKAQYKEDRTKSPDGTMFMSNLRHMAIKYGPLTEYIPAAPVGHVQAADMDKFREAGRKNWEAATKTHIPVEVRVTRHGEEFTGYQLPTFPAVSSPDVQKFINKVHAITQDIWLEKPAELVAIHNGKSPSHAGSYNQYFSTMLFVNGETRPLGYNAMDGLIRMCREPEVTIEQLRLMTPHLLNIPGEFLGYCGLNTMWEFIQEADELLPQVANKEEFMAFMETLALYVNHLNAWNLQLYPWSFGEEAFKYNGRK